ATPYAVMQFIAAPTLADRLASSSGPMDQSEFSRLARAILTILQVAHDRGYVHRDLKPANILLPSGSPGALLIDFGLSKSLVLGDQPNLTAVGTVLGTHEYMAPELLDGAGASVDPAIDIYAAGIVFFEMLTGRRPFLGTSAEVEYAHRNIRAPAPSNFAAVPEKLDSVLLRCLAKEPSERYSSASSLLESLECALSCASRHRRVERSSGAAATVTDTNERRSVTLVAFEACQEQ